MKLLHALSYAHGFSLTILQLNFYIVICGHLIYNVKEGSEYFFLFIYLDDEL